MGHLWSSAGHDAAGSQATESPGPARKGPTEEVLSLEVGGAPSPVLAPGLLPGRCLPGSDWARNLLSVLRDGEAGEALAASALSTATAFCGGWRWGQPTHGATPPTGPAHPRGHPALQGPV